MNYYYCDIQRFTGGGSTNDFEVDGIDSEVDAIENESITPFFGLGTESGVDACEMEAKIRVIEYYIEAIGVRR